MSGGSMEYLCYKVADVTFSQHIAARRAFAKHLKRVAKALHDIEWVDSGDYDPGKESEAIRDCLSDGAVLEAAIELAHKAHRELTEELERACRGTQTDLNQLR